MNKHLLGFILTETSLLLIAKHLLSQGLNPLLFLFVTGMISSAGLAVYLKAKSKIRKKDISFKLLKEVMPTSVFLALSAMVGLLALKAIPVVNYTLISRSTVFITPALAVIILKEKMPRYVYRFGLITLLGIWLLSGGTMVSFFDKKNLLALSAAVLLSLDFIYQRRATFNLPPEVIAFLRRFMGSLLIGIFLLFFYQSQQLSTYTIVMLLISSLLYVVLSISMAWALKTEKASDFNLYITFTPALAAIFAVKLLKESLLAVQWLGAATVFLGVLGYNLIKKYDSRNNSR